MQITFRQMRLFLALADLGSVNAAARFMHVTQPTASTQLREITDAIGVPLHEVVSRRVHLTQAGEELARTARAIVGEWEAFRQSIDSIKGLTRGRLRVAVVSTAKYFMPRLLGEFCERHPDVEIALEVLNRDGVVARLRENMDDLYIMSMPPAGIAVESTPFMDNPLEIVAPPGHPLAKRRSVELRDLRDERFILRERGSGTRLATDAHFRKLRFSPLVRLELGSNEAIREAVAGKLGVAVISAHSLGRSDPGIAVLKVKGFPIRSRWYVVRRKGPALSPIAAAFLRDLLAHAESHRPGTAPRRAAA
jgi:LysR family transcriptional regulator, low CO2-responsive transcriptional regulator